MKDYVRKPFSVLAGIPGLTLHKGSSDKRKGQFRAICKHISLIFDQQRAGVETAVV
ncbi:MAG: hypothetical protein KIT57_02600 [Blastocatellales bacterium]|nr:hypothetical protein [Blastocatellales bacterium]